VEALPPLPEPLHGQRRREAARGCALALGLTAACVSATLAVTARVGALGEAAGLCQGLILLEAASALCCLVGLLCHDPGVIHRSEASCFPLPECVALHLSEGKPLDGLQNVTLGTRTFCVRCLVWRSGHSPAHHCRICQRCITDFDHHCAVYGRCIAGKGFWRRKCMVPRLCGAGNMDFFVGLISMGVAGPLTCIASVCAALLSSSDAALHWTAGCLIFAFASACLSLVQRSSCLWRIIRCCRMWGL